MVSREELQVYVSEKGYICIKQENSLEREPSVVALEPGQVITVIRWLQDALPEAQRLFTGFENTDDEESAR
jgi:hypothetical protein